MCVCVNMCSWLAGLHFSPKPTSLHAYMLVLVLELAGLNEVHSINSNRDRCVCVYRSSDGFLVIKTMGKIATIILKVDKVMRVDERERSKTR